MPVFLRYYCSRLFAVLIYSYELITIIFDTNFKNKMPAIFTHGFAAYTINKVLSDKITTLKLLIAVIICAMFSNVDVSVLPCILMLPGAMYF